MKDLDSVMAGATSAITHEWGFSRRRGFSYVIQPEISMVRLKGVRWHAQLFQGQI